MYILALDQGNTTLSAGVFSDDKLIAKKHKRTRRYDLAYKVIVTTLLKEMKAVYPLPSSIGISCSAPHLAEELRRVVESCFDCPILEISPELESDIVCLGNGLSDIGPDIFAASQGAYSLYGVNLLVISLGTTTTFTYIDHNAVIDGVIICPGLGISLQALKHCTPHLPMISFDFPSSVLGKDTVSAVSSGIFWGHLAMIESITNKLREKITSDFKTVMCGGHTRLMQAEADFINYFEPDLVMYGTQLLCKRNLQNEGI